MEHSFFTESISTVVEQLATDPKKGLTTLEAQTRLARKGPNKLAETVPPPWWRKLLEQFNQLVIWILLAATILSGALGDWLEASAIFAIVLLNALLGFFQERKAEEALSSLRKLSSPNARVLRDGSLSSIAAQELVQGDVVELEAGDRVPADLRLISNFGLRTQEAALTGESAPVEKDAAAVLPDESTVAERINMGFMGTSVIAGKGRGLVAATGMESELGRIAGFLQSEEREPTPLQKRLEELGHVLIFACLGLVALIFILQLWRGENLANTFLLAVSLAVAAVPEGLPAVVTIALALGLQRMVKRNALIRRLASVETLGSVTVICSDKTGTLTHNEMTVTEIVSATQHYRITGSGYAPEGEFMVDSRRAELAKEPELALALKIGLLCNDSHLTAPDNKDEYWRIVGDPTEGALIVAARKAGLGRDPEDVIANEIPFDSERKLMSVIVRHTDEQTAIYTKGAPEILLERCVFEQRPDEVVPLSPGRRDELRQKSREMADRALRVLGFAWRAADENFKTHVEHDLVFVALAGMIDPPREEARLAVAKCKSAGIRAVMITGDHPATALAIARQSGIADEQDRVVTGAQLDGLSDEELSEEVDKLAVYARVSPEHKLRVVKALKARGEVVAMTGDGVNDAPAVMMADIGIAMGITGTDVTKEASDMVLTDDNFASIVNAVEEGRGIYDNIQEFVHYLLSCNASEIALVLFAAVVGWPVPLIPLQLLWINLITDGIPALALAMEKPAADVMRRRPRPPQEPFFTYERGRRILLHGLIMAVVTIVGFSHAYLGEGIARAQATAFYITTFAQLFFSFACRSQRRTLPQLGLFSNPYLLGAIVLSSVVQLSLLWFPLTRKVFFVSAPTFGSDWWLIFFLALAPVTLVEVRKVVRRRFNKEPTADAAA
ncbi:MAG: cation-translocating P-type ATPase [Chthoniobacterales bacterium]